MEFIIYIFLFLFYVPAFYYSFNIDINSPYVKSIPLVKQSLFGFSINVFTDKKSQNKYFLVGAPLDTTKNSNVNNSGAVYSCPISKESTDCTQMSFNEYSEDSLLGYVVNSNEADGSIYTCAPRFMKSYANVKYVEGSCSELNEQFHEVDQIVNVDCKESMTKNPQDYSFRNCLTGGALVSLGSKQVLLTAPYSYGGRGLLINNIFNPNLNSRLSNYLKVTNIASEHQLTGYSMSIGDIFRLAGIKTVVLGAPGVSQYDTNKSQVKFGQVMFVKLNKNSMEYSGTIYGEQFGSAFGYSVLAIDLDGDKHDDMVVGAPFTDNNKGQVFVYWNSDVSHSSENPFTIPLDVNNKLTLNIMKKSSRSQFGICLENIGDINKDLISDLAVGAPFDNDGSGCVYVYLGNRNRILTLSQKIDGRMISPDIRGFGFSIFGKNQDLDLNKFPDFLIGAALSNHVVGVRTRPIIRVYAENMLASSDMLLPYSLENLQKCTVEGQQISCIELRIALYYYYPHLIDCPSNAGSKEIDFQIGLDLPILKTSKIKRIYFEDKSNLINDKVTISCKMPTASSSLILKAYKMHIPDNLFFNISVPIEVNLTWSMSLIDVPKRNWQNGELADLSLYPVLEQHGNGLINKINFGAGCTSSTCQPLLTIQPYLSLPKDGEEYLLYIGNVSEFKLDLRITNIAKSTEDRAYKTYLKIDYNSKNIIDSSENSDRRIYSDTGLIYAVPSPLEPQQQADASFKFSLSNDFIQSAKQNVYLNITLEAMSSQLHLKPINLKIKIKMVADIDLKVLVNPDNHPYKEHTIPGFDGIKSEEKIGPKMKVTVTLSNNLQNSVVLSSKLVIYFPWEISGNPNETHGQYMLYLLQTPKFSVTTGNKKIFCDARSLKNITNILNTKIFRPINVNEKLVDVFLKNISLPKNVPKLPKLSKRIKFSKKQADPNDKSDWGKTVIVDCLRGTARCVPVVCDIGPLSRHSGEITVQFDMRIWVHTLIENFIKHSFVHIEIPIFWIPLVNYDIVLKDKEGYFRSARIIAVNVQKPKPASSQELLYYVIISVIVGVLLLATIVVILYKLKFFTRKKIGNNKRK